MKYVLDTNIVLAYLRQNSIRTHIETNFAPFFKNNIPIISVVTIGEIESIILRNKWGERKLRAVNTLFDKCVVTKIKSRDLIKRYGEIDAFSQGKLTNLPLGMTSRNMGKNDLWIAATASILKAKLITTDKDFQHLDRIYLDLILVKI